MSNILPSLDQLAVLEAIVEAGSFSAAAERLHRSASTLSYSIRSLESALGIDLFDRSGHRAVLTDSGRLVLRQTRDVLGQARELGALAEQLRQGWEPRPVLVLDAFSPSSRSCTPFGGSATRTCRRSCSYVSSTHQA